MPLKLRELAKNRAGHRSSGREGARPSPTVEANEHIERDERLERELGIAGVAQGPVHDEIPPPADLADRTLAQYEEIRRRGISFDVSKTCSRPPRSTASFIYLDGEVHRQISTVM